VRFADEYFESVEKYNCLMMNGDFYKKHANYDFMLVYQLDAYVFRDELAYWCKKNFDYIGAPWFEGFSLSNNESKLLDVAGNGGFSLRKVKSFISILNHENDVKMTIKHYMADDQNEDMFFSRYAKEIDKKFKVALPDDAMFFSFECQPHKLYKMMKNKLPFGCHGWERYDFDFWEKHIDLTGVDFKSENKLNLKKLSKIRSVLDYKVGEYKSVYNRMIIAERELGRIKEEAISLKDKNDFKRKPVIGMQKINKIIFSNGMLRKKVVMDRIKGIMWSMLNFKKSMLLKSDDDMYSHAFLHESPLVTVVTITFNLINADREKHFRQCVKSVRDQIYKNIEHIIIDGASKDGTVELIREFADKGWVKYISEPDTGIYDAMNKGIVLAKGKYVIFLNSDDYWHGIDGVMESVRILEESGADFSYAPARIEKENGHPYKGSHPYRIPEIAHVFFSMPFCHQTMFTKKSVLLEESLFDTRFKSAGDYDLILRLCLKGYKSILVDNEFTTFRLGGFSGTNAQEGLNEVSNSYFDHLNRIVKISKEDCEKIFGNYFRGISKELAQELKKYEPYFDFEEYENSFKMKSRIKRMMRSLWNKMYFAIFSPRKFARKYITKLRKRNEKN
jgi:glycosyltransferase involved in cell wall biosynthesis